MDLTAMYLTVFILSMAIGAAVEHLVSGLFSVRDVGSAPIGLECRKSGKPTTRECKKCPQGA
jgi:hypothetical protein